MRVGVAIKVRHKIIARVSASSCLSKGKRDQDDIRLYWRSEPPPTIIGSAVTRHPCNASRWMLELL